MRISSQWLNEFVAVPESLELARVFEMAGVGVENAEDDVWSLEVTSNRGDWLCAIGLAREIAAMTDKRLRLHANHAAHEYSSESIAVEIENAADCTRYMAFSLEDVRIDESPDWMQKRLAECGMRAINNIVDITNYVMLETGQPLHAFDAATISDDQIVVRRARADETLLTLDGVERALNDSVLVIADAQKPIGLAGLMGGQDSEVTHKTQRVVLEAAHFAPTRVRRGARSLGLSTEASRRFERHVDPNGVANAAHRALALLQEHAGARVVSLVDSYPQPVAAPKVRLRASRCNAVLGLNLSIDTMANLLKRLGLGVEQNEAGQNEDALLITIPTFRNDIAREEDLIEEVARVHGYEHIAQTLPRTVNAMAGRSLSQRLEERAKSALLRCGLTEVVTISMQNAASVERAGLPVVPVVRLSNPLSEDYTQMRTSLVPSLLEVLEKNARVSLGADGVRVFELGKTYTPQDGQKQPRECRVLALALHETLALAHWLNSSGADAGENNRQDAARGFFQLKAVVETALSELGAPQVQWRSSREDGFHPSRCATLSIDAQDVGTLGEVHPDVASRYDLARAYLATIEFDPLVRHISLLRRYEPISRFPTVERDLALVLDAQIPASQVESVVREAGGALLQAAKTFDVYQGAPIPPESKSLALALRFGSSERTLTDAEVEAAMTRIRNRAERDLGAALR